MKLNKYISFGAVAIMAVAGLNSCDSKNDPAYIPAGTVSDTQRVYFSENTYTQVVSANETSFDFLIYRPDLNILDDNGEAITEMPAQTVTFSASCAEEGVLGNLITVPTEATFAAGSPNASITVTYDPAKMTGNHPYPIVLTIDPAYANEYGITQMTLNVNKEEYSEWELFYAGQKTDAKTGYGTYTFGVALNGTDYVRVYARSVPSDPEDIQFRFQWREDEDDPESFETFMTAYTKDGGKIVHVPEQLFMDYPGLGKIYVSDTYTYTNNDKYKGLTTFNPETGLFTLNLYYYLEDGSGAWGPGNEYLQLEGYKDMNDYTLSVQPQGQVSIGGKDYETVSFDFTEAVTYVDYTVVEGELEEEEANAVMEKMMDPEQTQYTVTRLKSPQNVALTFPSSGDYTVVAVGYNEAVDGTVEAKCTAYASFSFETFDPYAGWKTVTKNALFTDYLISWLYMDDLTPMELTVQIDESEEFEGLYRITNPYAEFADDLDIEPFGSIEFEVIDNEHVNFPMSTPGILYQGTPIEVCSYANFYMDNGYGVSDIPSQYWGTYKDGVISLNALNVESSSSFILFLGDKAFYLDIDFLLDMNGGQASASRISRKLTDTIVRRMASGSVKKIPSKAYYKAIAQETTRKLDRKSVKPMKIRR